MQLIFTFNYFKDKDNQIIQLKNYQCDIVDDDKQEVECIYDHDCTFFITKTIITTKTIPDQIYLYLFKNNELPEKREGVTNIFTDQLTALCKLFFIYEYSYDTDPQSNNYIKVLKYNGKKYIDDTIYELVTYKQQVRDVNYKEEATIFIKDSNTNKFIYPYECDESILNEPTELFEVHVHEFLKEKYGNDNYEQIKVLFDLLDKDKKPLTIQLKFDEYLKEKYGHDNYKQIKLFFDLLDKYKKPIKFKLQIIDSDDDDYILL